MLPNLIVVGMTKCGTTALHDIFRKSKSVHVPNIKECRYFTHRLRKNEGINKDYSSIYFNSGVENIQDYKNLFNPRFKINADISNDYSFFYEDAILEIKKTYEAASQPLPKILFLLKKPSSRILSQYLHNVRIGVESRTLNKALEEVGAKPSSAWTIDYQSMFQEYEGVIRWSEEFNDVKITTWKDLYLNSGLLSLSRWLDIDSDFEFNEDFKRSPKLLTKSKAHAFFLKRSFAMGLKLSFYFRNRLFKILLRLAKNCIERISLKEEDLDIPSTLYKYDARYYKILENCRSKNIVL